MIYSDNRIGLFHQKQAAASNVALVDLRFESNVCHPISELEFESLKKS